MSTEKAVNKIAQALKSDKKKPGGFYDSWKSTIAMCIKDEAAKNGKVRVSHEFANAAADRFLTLLISDAN